MAEGRESGHNHTAARFTQTHWSVIVHAQDPLSPEGREALGNLCQIYWYPVYAFVRRRGIDPHKAQDLTQDFFLHLLEGDRLQTVSREKGRFRSFLLKVLINFLNNAWDRDHAQKREGAHHVLSLDEMMAEQLYGGEPVEDRSPETGFDRRWAATLVNLGLKRLRDEQAARGKAELFAALSPLLVAPAEAGAFATLTDRFGLAEGALRTALSRLRQRFREQLREEVAQTVALPGDVDEELRYLMKVWAATSS